MTDVVHSIDRAYVSIPFHEHERLLECERELQDLKGLLIIHGRPWEPKPGGTILVADDGSDK